MVVGWWNLAGWPTPEEWSALWALGAVIVGLGTLCAAIAAGIYAARAAKATREQASAVGEEVAVARRALEIAEAESSATRREAERAIRWAEERRIDGLAPNVFMEAHPDSGNPALGFSLEKKTPSGAWRMLEEPDSFDLRMVGGVKFRQTVKIKLSNLSGYPARVDFIQPDRGVLATQDGVLLSKGGPVWVLPHTDTLVVWQRQVGPADLLSNGDEPAKGVYFRVEAWVRDSGLNVCDLCRFHGNITDVGGRGYEVTVRGVPPTYWPDRVAYLVKRQYTRLETGGASEEESG